MQETEANGGKGKNGVKSVISLSLSLSLCIYILISLSSHLQAHKDLKRAQKLDKHMH